MYYVVGVTGTVVKCMEIDRKCSWEQGGNGADIDCRVTVYFLLQKDGGSFPESRATVQLPCLSALFFGLASSITTRRILDKLLLLMLVVVNGVFVSE